MKKIFLTQVPLKLLHKYIKNPQKIEKCHRLERIFRWQQHHKGFFHADFIGMICILYEENPKAISFRDIYRLCRVLSCPKIQDV